MIRHDVNKFVAELRLLQSQCALVNLLLKHLSGILVVHELPHPWREEPLVGELLCLSLLGLFVTLFGKLSLFGLIVFCLSAKSRVVKTGVAHELVLDHLHPSHDWHWVTLLNDIDVISRKVNFLLAPLSHWLLLRCLIALLLLLLLVRWLQLILIHDTDGPLGLTAQEHRVVLPLDPLYDLLRFRAHLIGMLDLGLQALDDWEDVVRLAHWDIKLVVGCFPPSQLVFLFNSKL